MNKELEACKKECAGKIKKYEDEIRSLEKKNEEIKNARRREKESYEKFKKDGMLEKDTKCRPLEDKTAELSRAHNKVSEEAKQEFAVENKQLMNENHDLTEKVAKISRLLEQEQEANAFSLKEFTVKAEAQETLNHQLQDKLKKMEEIMGKEQEANKAKEKTSSIYRHEVSKCDICNDRKKEYALECGHVFCEVCVARFKKCPYCNKPVANLRKIFLSI